MNRQRVRLIHGNEYVDGNVVYIMCRELRVRDNDALLFSTELAVSGKGVLSVVYPVWNYSWQGATARFYNWVLRSLREIEEDLLPYNIPLSISLLDKTMHLDIPASCKAIVIEQLPLVFMRVFREALIKDYPNISLYEVDAHNIIPVWETSSKQEFSARTIRPKIKDKLRLYIEEYDHIGTSFLSNTKKDVSKRVDFSNIEKQLVYRKDVSGVTSFVPGEQEALTILNNFITQKLPAYEHDRNIINIDGQSNLSPYISHGNISRRRIILDLLKQKSLSVDYVISETVNGSNGNMGSIASFVEECVVRAELAENFCYYNPFYYSDRGFPKWAQEALQKASTDTREHIYSLKEFEEARTHDPLWNAAQLQMVHTGKMHGYMRMYWAKKILEWSSTYEEAMNIAVYLNDVYELDGRDPNGYVGCAWSIGGLHDRPWFPRPIFGTVRYMARSGVEKRGDVKEYIRGQEQKLF